MSFDRQFETDFSHCEPLSRQLPRRLRLSAREIGVAVALTFAALVQLALALSSKVDKSNASQAQAEAPALVRAAP